MATIDSISLDQLPDMPVDRTRLLDLKLATAPHDDLEAASLELVIHDYGIDSEGRWRVCVSYNNNTGHRVSFKWFMLYRDGARIYVTLYNTVVKSIAQIYLN